MTLDLYRLTIIPVVLRVIIVNTNCGMVADRRSATGG